MEMEQAILVLLTLMTKEIQKFYIMDLMGIRITTLIYESEMIETLQRGLIVLQKENYITKSWRLIYGKNKIYIVAITMFY